MSKFNKAYREVITEASNKSIAYIGLDEEDFSSEAYSQVADAIKMLGGFIYEVPSCVGSGNFHYIVSKTKLSKKEIAELDDY